MKFLRTFSMLTLALGVELCVPQRATAAEDDPPGRAARLAYTQGSVSFQPAGTDDWVSAAVNRPITTGDKLWTDRGARAELQIGSAAIRLAGETGFSFLNLTDDIAQIRLSEGVISIHLRHLDRNETVEVDTPNLAFNLLRPGDYRLEVNEAGDTTVISVRGGEGEVTGDAQAFTVHSNQRVTFTGTDQLSADLESLGGYDDFDRWSRDRDNRQDRVASTRYVSRGVIGYEDLDDYGDWRTVPAYGPIWVPRTVIVGWAPYRHGHWVWISPWGWTWVDDAPWGFAPFHYGRWVFVGGAWGWSPGPVVARPVYAPALVAWVGGPRFSIGVGAVAGGVAWFPLGPREVYVPPYRVSRTYVTNVNVTNMRVNKTYVTNVYNTYTSNNTTVTNIKYVNHTAPGAVTATSQTAFASGQPVQRNLVIVDARQVARAQVNTNVGVVPQQRSVLGAADAAQVKPPPAVQTRVVVAKTTPPPAPVPFAKQQQAIQSKEGRPFGRQEVQRLEPQRTEAAAPVKVVKAAPKSVPVESVARSKPDQPEQLNRPAPSVPLAPNQPAQQVPQQNQRIREDRPPSAQPNRAQPPQNARDAKLERKHDQKLQKLQQQQEQERQKLEHMQQQQQQKTQQQAENQRQQQEHRKLQQKQEQERQKLEQKQQRQQKVHQEEAKQRQKQQQQEPR